MGMALTKAEDSKVKRYEKKITWTIKNFSSLQYERIYSDYFEFRSCKWRLRFHPKGSIYNENHLSLFLEVVDSELPYCGRIKNIKYRLTIVNQLQEELSEFKESEPILFDQRHPSWGFLLPLIKLQEKDGGLLVNDEVKIIAEIEILEVIGKSDALEEETTPITETIIDNRFQFLPSQVKYVNSLFEIHQEIATNQKNQYETKFTWTVKNFSSLQYEPIYSDNFVVSGCKWRLKAFLKGNRDLPFHVALYLEVPDSELLPSEWRRWANFRLTLVNQLREELSHVEESEPRCFHQKHSISGFADMLPLSFLYDDGFLVNDEVKIIAEVYVLEVFRKSDALEEKTSPVMENIDVNGFQVLPSQVKSVNNLFERHPNIATNVKSQYLKTGFMNVLLSLTDTLEKLTENFSNDDLLDAYVALEHMTNAGFDLDWLKNKFDQVEENIRKEEAGEIQMQAIKEKNIDLSRWNPQIEVTKRKPKWKKTLHQVSKLASVVQRETT